MAFSATTTQGIPLSNLLLVIPGQGPGYQPQDANGGPNAESPILFHYEGEQTILLESDITDHWVENNSAVNDQIALRPIQVTTHGFIGELNDVAPFPLTVLKLIANKLVTIDAYVPQLSTTALLAYNEAFQAYQVAKNGFNTLASLVGSIPGDPSGANKFTQTKQQTVFNKFRAYWQNRTLFTVQTPWAVFKNMAIKTLRPIQSAETDMITDFEVTFKQIQYASTRTLFEANPHANLQNDNRADAASAEIENGSPEIATDNATFPADPTTGVA